MISFFLWSKANAENEASPVPEIWDFDQAKFIFGHSSGSKGSFDAENWEEVCGVEFVMSIDLKSGTMALQVLLRPIDETKPGPRFCCNFPALSCSPDIHHGRNMTQQFLIM